MKMVIKKPARFNIMSRLHTLNIMAFCTLTPEIHSNKKINANLGIM